MRKFCLAVAFLFAIASIADAQHVVRRPVAPRAGIFGGALHGTGGLHGVHGGRGVIFVPGRGFVGGGLGYGGIVPGLLGGGYGVGGLGGGYGGGVQQIEIQRQIELQALLAQQRAYQSFSSFSQYTVPPVASMPYANIQPGLAALCPVIPPAAAIGGYGVGSYGAGLTVVHIGGIPHHFNGKTFTRIR